ncbi:beta-ketoacyl synthase chain length factor [Methylomonas sp. MgM2]
MRCMSVLGFAACSPDAELRRQLPFPCGDILRDTIPAALRRRSSEAMQLTFSVATEVCHLTGRSPAELPAIFASVAGEIQTTDHICTELVKPDGLISPSAFHNSVQNTAAGYWSIAHRCTQAASALAAGRDTVAMGLLEAWCQLACYGGEILLVCYDERCPGYLMPGSGRPGFATALILAAGAVEGNITRLCRPRRQAAEFPRSWTALAEAMPVLNAIPLLDRVANQCETDALPLSAAWVVDIGA